MTKKWQRASKNAKKLGSPSKKNTQKCKAKDTSSSSEDDSNQDNSDNASNPELRKKRRHDQLLKTSKLPRANKLVLTQVKKA